MITSINEFKKILENYQVYHNSYGSAIDAVKDYADLVKYEVKEDDIVSTYIDGFFKPKEGKTKSDSFELYKNGKLQNKMLHVQIYNRGNDKFELNMYIN